MIFKRIPFYQYPEGDQAGTGGGAGAPPAVTPASAREFLTPFVPDPKILTGMDDKGVLEYHTRINGALDKVRPKSNGKWPETWRQELAGGDEKALKQLERYSDPAALYTKTRALEARITSGELRSLPPKDATPEAMAAWRAENGIPVEPTKYDLKLKDGMVIGAEDKPIFDAILTKLHGKNVTNEQASELVTAYYEVMDGQAKKGAELQAQQRQKVEDQLHAEWGGEFRGNMNRIASLVDANLKADDPLRKKIMTTVGTDVAFAKLMESFARQINPVSTLIPGAGENFAGALDDEIKTIEDRMRKDRDGYNKDEKMQERYRLLLQARADAKARA